MTKEALVKPLEQIVEFLSKNIKQPKLAVVLGSGVQVLDQMDNSRTYTYDEVFGISPTVHGHSGSLTIGEITSKSSTVSIAVFRGRFHLYEGHDWSVVTLPARVVTRWEIPHFVVTNAAGGLNSSFSIGDLMVVTGYRDHLSPRWKEEGLLQAVSAEPTNCENVLTRQILEIGETLSEQTKDFRPLRTGVYAALLGPSYETLAEIEMLRRLKSDAVGMSTVPELLTAAESKTTAAAISVVTNVWEENTPMGGHEEVLEASKLASERLDKLLRALAAKL
ncbi:MAG: purine-nucleoside phosphorylase [Cyanobacteria bacterium]|nr:purine-nucleoside phosphorylase [Cyanobacteriota bacterium]